MSRDFEPNADGIATSRKLLGDFTVLGIVATQVNRAGVKLPKHGIRGVKRRAHKRRRKVLATTLQRNSWRAYGEARKDETL